MTRYPSLVAALADVDLAALAALANLPQSDIEWWAAGAVAPLHLRARLAAALAVDVDGYGRPLFCLDDELEQALPPGKARYVTAPAVLRAWDSRPR